MIGGAFAIAITFIFDSGILHLPTEQEPPRRAHGTRRRRVPRRLQRTLGAGHARDRPPRATCRRAKVGPTTSHLRRRSHPMPNEAHATAVGAVVHLGKLEVKHDARNLKLARYIDDAVVLPEVPKSIDWSAKVKSWPMYGNDKLGDCTCAAVGHMTEAWTANAGHEKLPTEQAVEGLYWATGSQDTGRYCLRRAQLLAVDGIRQRRQAHRLRAGRREQPGARRVHVLGVRRRLHRGAAPQERPDARKRSGRSRAGPTRSPAPGAATASTSSITRATARPA